ncbi:MAG: hypothetical protein WC374_01150 [Phycisphaerae bacterium]|jgi:hypothetical protein
MAEQQSSYQAVNAEQVEKLLDSPDFIHREKCGDGIPIFTFRFPDESIEGRIRPCKLQDRTDRARTAELEYYRLDGDVRKIAIRLNKRLLKTIRQNHLWGEVIRITYKGSIRGKLQYAEKIYLIEKVTGFLTENSERVEDGDCKRTKHRDKKPIRRPLTDARRKAGEESSRAAARNAGQNSREKKS